MKFPPQFRLKNLSYQWSYEPGGSLGLMKLFFTKHFLFFNRLNWLNCGRSMCRITSKYQFQIIKGSISVLYLVLPYKSIMRCDLPLVVEVAPSTNLLKTLCIDEVFKDFCKLQTVETRLSMDEILNKHVKVFMIITHQYLKD